jgi:hypothetical protein
MCVEKREIEFWSSPGDSGGDGQRTEAGTEGERFRPHVNQLMMILMRYNIYGAAVYTWAPMMI